MRWRIAEQFLRGKYGDANRNEDVIHVSDSFFAVVDGATAKNPGLFEGGAPGRAIAHAVADALAALQPGVQLEAALKSINVAIRADKRLRAAASARRTTRDVPSAAMVVFSVAREEVWVIGDCSFSIDGRVEKFGKKIDEVDANYRALVNQLLLLKGRTVQELRAKDEGRDSIMKVLRYQTIFQNNPEAGEFAYGMLDGSDEVIGFAKCISVAGARSIILASDGYPVVCQTLAESEAELKRVLEDDPLFIRSFKQTKGLGAGQESFDDRAYLRIERA